MALALFGDLLLQRRFTGADSILFLVARYEETGAEPLVVDQLVAGQTELHALNHFRVGVVDKPELLEYLVRKGNGFFQGFP